MDCLSTEESAGTPKNPVTDHRIVVIVKKDETGFGMKITGENPVYVESVKKGGAASLAGLQCGDTIIKVNGVTVTESKHTHVVRLITASNNLELTVQQKIKQHTTPLPGDLIKRRLLESQEVLDLRIMLENDSQYVEALRSELAKIIGQGQAEHELKITREIESAERRVNSTQEALKNLV